MLNVCVTNEERKEAILRRAIGAEECKQDGKHFLWKIILDGNSQIQEYITKHPEEKARSEQLTLF